MNTPTFRFAPSPNGEIHLGHAYSAMLNLRHAREAGGKVLLRIEDIDPIRCKPEHEVQMLKDLEWFGFEWDEAPRRQSEQFDDYYAALRELEALNVVFPSTHSRSEIKKLLQKKADQPKDPDGAPHYPGSEHLLSADQQKTILQSNLPYALRLNTEQADIPPNLTWQEKQNSRIDADPKQWGKPVLARKDSPASYHLCCVVDDALQGVTNIVRGMDLYEATSLQRLLQELLNLPEPTYYHHDLILDEDGKKLSKSKQNTSLKQLRESGMTPSDIHEILAEKASNEI